MISVENGIVFASDSRTNAGLDNVNTYRKMHTFTSQADRSIVVMSAGNLATTQAVIRRISMEENNHECIGTSFSNVIYMCDAAEYLGRVSREVQNHQQSAFETGSIIYYWCTELLSAPSQ